MKGDSLTKAFIINKKDSKKINLKEYISKIKEFQHYPYFLVINSVIENCVRINIYPVNSNNLIKVTLFGPNLNDVSISNLEFFHDFKIIHTSGLLLKDNELYYECYLDLKLKDEKSKVLKAFLNNNKTIFGKIKIEEINTSTPRSPKNRWLTALLRRIQRH